MIPTRGGGLGFVERIADLEEQFSDPTTKQKLQILGRSAPLYRRSRGDGNCFYRAVGFGLLEQLVSAAPAQRQHWAAHLYGLFQNLSFEACPDKSIAEAHTELLARFLRLARGGSWEEINS